MRVKAPENRKKNYSTLYVCWWKVAVKSEYASLKLLFMIWLDQDFIFNIFTYLYRLFQVWPKYRFKLVTVNPALTDPRETEICL